MTVVDDPATVTDVLGVLRGELRDLLATLDVPFHDYEPRSAGQVPLFYLGRPELSFVDFERVVEVVWPIVLVLHTVDTEGGQRDGDALLWNVWRALGGGSERMLADNQRTCQVTSARPSTTVTLGDVTFVAYDLTARFTMHVTICDP